LYDEYPILRFFYHINCAVAVGFGIGYVVKPAGVQSVRAANTSFDQHFHPRDKLQEKNTKKAPAWWLPAKRINA